MTQILNVKMPADEVESKKKKPVSIWYSIWMGMLWLLLVLLLFPLVYIFVNQVWWNQDTLIHYLLLMAMSIWVKISNKKK